MEPEEAPEPGDVTEAEAPEVAAEEVSVKSELEGMAVKELRKMARQTEGIGIVGREISAANKNLLIQEITKARLNNAK